MNAVKNKLFRVSVSGMFTAILDCILDVPYDERRTDPIIEGLVVTSDDCLLGQREGHVGFNDFIGSAADLDRNLRGVAKVAELTEEETAWLLLQFKDAPYLIWDEYVLAEEEAKYRLDNNVYDEDDNGNPPDEDWVRHMVYTDYDFWEDQWEWFINTFTELMHEFSPEGEWDHEGWGMTWQNIHGSSRIHADTPDELFPKILCRYRNADFSLYVYKEDDHIRMRYSHHDSPTGEGHELWPA